MESDERLACLLEDFDKRYIAKDYLSRKPIKIHITPDMIDSLANKSYPPCMRQLNDILRSTHHLKHHGRFMYGLFLKAAGLSMEDLLTFWRNHFLQIMDEEMVWEALFRWIQDSLCYFSCHLYIKLWNYHMTLICKDTAMEYLRFIKYQDSNARVVMKMSRKEKKRQGAELNVYN